VRSSPDSTVTTLVVMGVSGVGKTTVALELQRRLGWDYAEGDDFHPTANKEKMAAGHPLDDEDRWPWLKTIAQWIGDHERSGTSAIVTCSALRRAYRDLLRDGHPSVWFAHVMVSTGLLHDRVEHRRGHYMPPSLLGSQLSTLEPLQPDEPGLGVSGDGPPDVVADEILATLTSRDAGDNPHERTSP
jgi:gluconokinase